MHFNLFLIWLVCTGWLMCLFLLFGLTSVHGDLMVSLFQDLAKSLALAIFLQLGQIRKIEQLCMRNAWVIGITASTLKLRRVHHLLLCTGLLRRWLLDRTALDIFFFYFSDSSTAWLPVSDIDVSRLDSRLQYDWLTSFGLYHSCKSSLMLVFTALKKVWGIAIPPTQP